MNGLYFLGSFSIVFKINELLIKLVSIMIENIMRWMIFDVFGLMKCDLVMEILGLLFSGWKFDEFIFFIRLK